MTVTEHRQGKLGQGVPPNMVVALMVVSFLAPLSHSVAGVAVALLVLLLWRTQRVRIASTTAVGLVAAAFVAGVLVALAAGVVTHWEEFVTGYKEGAGLF